MRAHALRQVQLHDIALLAPRLDAARLGQTTGHAGRRGAAAGGCIRRSSSACATTRVAHRCRLEDFARACPRVLRRASARVDAHQRLLVEPAHSRVPGNWPGRASPLDALRYAQQRVMPDRVAHRRTVARRTPRSPRCSAGALVRPGTSATHPALARFAAATRADHDVAARRARRRFIVRPAVNTCPESRLPCGSHPRAARSPARRVRPAGAAARLAAAAGCRAPAPRALPRAR